jgi:hypothetical protein
MAQERYFIGPGLRDKLRETITRVDGMMDRQSGVKSQTVHQDMMPSGGGKVFRVCTYTGAWAIDGLKTVTFKYKTTTPNTVSATNLFLPLPENGTRDCAVAKDGTAWFLVQAQMELAHAFTAATLTTSSIEFNTLPVMAFASASTNKFTLTPPTESVIVGASLGTDSLSFSRKNVGVFFASTAGTVAISVTTCSTAAS